MSRVSALTLSTGENNAYSMVTDGTYAYVGTDTSPAKVVKVRLSDMSRVSALTLNTGENRAFSMVNDGSYTYVASYTNPINVAKIQTKTGNLIFEIQSSGKKYIVTDNSLLIPGNQYSIMVSGDGSKIQMAKNGVFISDSANYTEPAGVLQTSMFIGSDYFATNHANGIIDDLRISSRARSIAEHQATYNSGQPLPEDQDTTLLMNFDNSLYNFGMVYNYDDINQLNSIQSDNYDVTFQYDMNGNLIHRSVN